MSAAWIEATVMDFVDSGEAEIKTGPFGTQLHASDYVEEGTPVINVRNIGFGDIREDKLEYISEDTVARLSSHLLRPGDIVFGRKGAVERHAFVQDRQAGWFQGSDCIRLRIKSEEVDGRFLSYCFLTNEHKSWMLNQGSHGATMASLNQEIIGRIPLHLPDIGDQRRIVDILSAYDDLIENNRRRIAILEEMARALYREWFVEFRFPGHEGARLVETVAGLAPEGWEVKAVGEAFETLGGGTPSTKVHEYWEDGDVIWFSPTDLTAAGSMFVGCSAKRITALGLSKSAAKMFPPYSVMMTSRATIGVIAINTEPACTNQGFITCIPNDRLSALQIYFWIESSRDSIISLASGATFKEISRGEFREMPIVAPPAALSEEYAKLAWQFAKEIENLLRRNQVLRATRDLLLPKLVSGDLITPDMERTASPV